MKTHHGTKIQSLEAKKAREMEQLENARQELAKIQEQLDAHLHDKQSLHEELDQMRKLQKIQCKFYPFFNPKNHNLPFNFCPFIRT